MNGFNMKDEKETKHPAFGVISVSRVSGHTRLFGSDFTHHNYISLRISTAKTFEGYGVKTSIHNDEQIVEVCLSEVQFARMITALNMGCGTPCTLEYVNMPGSLEKYQGQRIPQVEAEDIRETHKDKIKQMVEERLEDVKNIENQIEQWRESKHRPTLAELDELLRSLRRLHLASNLAYCQEILEEKMERTIEEGRTEIEAHITNLMTQFGLDEIHKKQLPDIPHAPTKRLDQSDD